MEIVIFCNKVAPLGQMYTRIIVTEFKRIQGIDIDELENLSPDEEYFKID